MSTINQVYDRHKNSWEETELFLKWTLSREDKAVVLYFRGAPARLHAAIQLLTIKHSGRTWTGSDSVPTNILQVICEFLEIDPIPPDEIKVHASTASKQLKIILKYLALEEYDDKAKSILQNLAQNLVGSQRLEAEFLQEAEHLLKAESYLLPAVSTLQRDLRAARAKAEEILFLYIADQILPHQKLYTRFGSFLVMTFPFFPE